MIWADGGQHRLVLLGPKVPTGAREFQFANVDVYFSAGLSRHGEHVHSADALAREVDYIGGHLTEISVTATPAATGWSPVAFFPNLNVELPRSRVGMPLTAEAHMRELLVNFYLHQAAAFVNLADALPRWKTLTHSSSGIGLLSVLFRIVVLASLLELWRHRPRRDPSQEIARPEPQRPVG